MVDILNLVSDEWLELIWRVTWQGSVFIGIVFLVTKIFRRLSPTIKHLLWMLVIVKFLIMPFVTVPIALPVFPTLAHKSPITPIAETPVLPQGSGVISEPLHALPTETLPTATSVSHPKVTVHIPSVLFSIWLCGIIILLLGITFRSIKLKKDISSAKVLEDKNILNIVAEGIKEFRIRPPILKISDKFKSPLACGIILPVIIFPEHIIEKFTGSEIRAIIYHELAHIKRLDIFTNWFQILTQIVYFFNPLIWYVNRQIRIEREHACDDWVLQIGGEPRKTYADALLKVVELCSGRERFALGIVGVSETFALMAGRLKTIMDAGRKINTRLSLKLIIGLVLIGVTVMPSCVGKKSSAPDSVQSEHYKNGWLKHLGNPTDKEGWQKESAEKAIAEFQKALEIDPDNVIYRHSLAFAYEKSRQIEKAEEEYKKVIELKPQDSFIHYALARLYAKGNATLDKAISELKIAIQKNPNEALFHYHLAHLFYTRAGEYEKGRQYLITDEELAKQAFEEIKIANTIEQFTEYLSPFPRDASNKMDYIRVISLWSDEMLPEHTIMLDLGKMNTALGKYYEAQGEVRRAEEVYLTSLIIGKKYAAQKSLALIKFLAGVAIDSNAFNALEKLYSVQGMQEKVQWVKEGKEKLNEIYKLIEKKATEMSKHSIPFWTKEEKTLKEIEGDLLFLEAPFIREMLKIWPVISERAKFQEIIKIAREHLFREKPEMKQVQLKEPNGINIDSANKLIDVSFSIFSEAKTEEIEGRATRTTFPTVIVKMDFTGNLISIKNSSSVETRYPPGETERLLRILDGKPEWESIFSVLTSQNPIALSAACQAIEKLGKNAIPKLLEGATDKRPLRYSANRSDRGKFFSGEWHISEVLKEGYWTIGDLCLAIACDLVEYPLIYNGAIGDDVTKEDHEAFRNYTYLAIKDWYEKHKDEPQVLTIDKEEKEYIHNTWREFEKKALNMED